MNSYWAEEYARQHVGQMAADATGDKLLMEATRQASNSPEPAGLSPIWRNRARIQALALRQLRFPARAR
jgi:hypothetical protein